MMRSPEVAAGSSSHPAQASQQQLAGNARNGFHSSNDTVSSNGADSNTQVEQANNDSAPNALIEGKHNAKAVFAASGLQLPSSAANPDPTNNVTTVRTKANGANGRKRSRGGTTISGSSSTGASSVHVRETPVQKIMLEQYVNREFYQCAALASRPNSHQEIFQQKRAERDSYLALRRETHLNLAALFGVGYEGFGNSRTDLPGQQTHLLYPAHRRRPGGRKTRELRVTRDDLKAQNEQIEDLVPIRLDIDWEKIKIRDTFTWNLHDRVVSPDLFAEKLVEDLGLPLESCAPLIRMVSQNIQEQLTDYYPQVFIEEGPLDPHLPYNAYKNDEMRILIKLNITIGQHTLVDQFEWDINDPLNSPEEFALRMTNDLSLSGEFTTAIAHSIREQGQLYTKSLYIVSHPFDGRPVEDPDLKASFLPSPLPSAFRPFQAAKEFTPYLYELNEAELERTEVSISREQRRQKRSVNRRGGPALPDLKDRQRTIRTLLVSSVIPNSVSTIQESNIFKRSGSGRRGRSAAQRDGVDDSDESDSEESSTGSPAIGPHLAQGTARTRGMRGAATAAHAALRASLGHSVTPEPHNEARLSARRRDYKEDSVEEQEKLIVKLKISRDKFRQFVKTLKDKPRPHSLGTRLSSHSGSQTPKSMAPPRPPGQPPGRPFKDGRIPTQQLGAVDAPNPPQPGVPGPPPPEWLVRGLTRLNRAYSRDSFEAVMRYSAVDVKTLLPVTNTNLTQPGQQLKYQYLPRIRCHDCPGKLYTPGPGTTVDNFEVHLKNRQHKERVEERLRKAAAGVVDLPIESAQ